MLLMDGLSACGCSGLFVLPPARNKLPASRRSGLMVLASKDGANLDHWDRMELKFGRLIGEDPKLTLAKIMGRKSNPDTSYLDIEKSFSKNKGSLPDEIPLHDSEEVEQYKTSNIFYHSEDKTSGKDLSLVHPVMKNRIERPSSESVSVAEKNSNSVSRKIHKQSGVSHVTLRKPCIVRSGNIEKQKSSKLELKPNMLLKMRRNLNHNVNDRLTHKDNVSDITLLKKPDPLLLSSNFIQDNTTDSDFIGSNCNALLSNNLESNNEIKLPAVPQQNSQFISSVECFQRCSETESSALGLSEQMDEFKNENSKSVKSVEAVLQGKPERSNLPPMYYDAGVLERNLRGKVQSDAAEVEQEKPPSIVLEENADGDWTKVEELFQRGKRAELELIGCSSRGFFVSFGSLVGYLPYRDLGAKWRFLAFESWLRTKGFDPSLYKQNLSILGSYKVRRGNLSQDSNPDQKSDQKYRNVPVEDLLNEYDAEKKKFLSSFIGQKIKATVVLADRNSRKLLFSGREKENEELTERKRNLMARLNVGDIVKCTITKMTYFGIFVELEGVPALVHQSEVSWDVNLDPMSHFRIGQTVEAKVQQLDFGLGRITLSLKQIRPDPLTEALESLESSVGDGSILDAKLETRKADFEWTDVESLINELRKINGINRVSKGRSFLSPGLAPTFQVYMASVFQNQYKLLARSGNKVQEVIVQASLDAEQMKVAILTCTNGLLE